VAFDVRAALGCEARRELIGSAGVRSQLAFFRLLPFVLLEHVEFIGAAADAAEGVDDSRDLPKPQSQPPDNSAELAGLKGKSNIVVSLGKVEDLGQRAGALLAGMAELNALGARDPNTLTPDEKRRLLELQRDNAKLLGALPEITKFQDSPDEYGRFFKTMMQQAVGLNEAEAAQVESFMRQRAVEMNQLGLNAAKEPTDAKAEEEWEERRDKFNEQTAESLKKVLPPGAAEKAGISKELMEFLEMDFDKVAPKAGSQPQ
jgi:hypothetical protein